jgi:5'-deoxynucleotidase YfbR-like HD superfamily hydrolase
MRAIVEANLFRAAADTRRYHTQRMLRDQTVGQHTFNMLLLLQQVAPDTRKEVLVAVMHHDLPEYFTGDMPAPIKRASPALKVLMDELETDLAPLYRELDLTPEEWALIKWADLMELTLFSLEELKMGNTFARTAFVNGLTWMLDAVAPNQKCAGLLYDTCLEAVKHGITDVTIPSDLTEGGAT